MNSNFSDEFDRYNHLINELDSVYHSASVKLGLSDSALQILYTLYISDGQCLLGDMLRWTGMSKQTANSSLRNLEAEGALRAEDAGGRKKMLFLTESGRELAERTAGRLLSAERSIFSSWTEEDRQRFLELTERFLTALHEQVEAM